MSIGRRQLIWNPLSQPSHSSMHAPLSQLLQTSQAVSSLASLSLLSLLLLSLSSTGDFDGTLRFFIDMTFRLLLQVNVSDSWQWIIRTAVQCKYTASVQSHRHCKMLATHTTTPNRTALVVESLTVQMLGQHQLLPPAQPINHCCIARQLN